MRYLGIDYGSKRIGLALSDEKGLLAFPYKTLNGANSDTIIKEIKKIISKENVEKIVIGLPFTLKSQMSFQAQKVRRFGEALSSLVQLPIVFENEIFTSRMAEKSGVSREKLDASAAALILQDFLDKQKKS